MLKLENIEITYENGKKAVSDFNLALKKGEIIGIVGESGSGKSTLIKSIVGGLRGRAEIRGKIIFENEDILSKRKIETGKEITIIFQETRHTLNPVRKIGKQYIEYIREHENLSKEEAWQKAFEMLKKTNLPDPENVMNSYPYQLSGGMCQRVGIAMAMTFNPKILLADEPTSALDVTTQAQIVEELLKMRDIYKTSMIVVTHSLGVASYLSDRIVVMKEGKIVELGETEKVLKNPQSEYTKLLITAMPKLEG